MHLPDVVEVHDDTSCCNCAEQSPIKEQVEFKTSSFAHVARNGYASTHKYHIQTKKYPRLRVLATTMLATWCTIMSHIEANIPTYPLSGGGTIPMLAMGGNDFAGWFKAAGKGAMIQTFHGYDTSLIHVST